jgi:hypothetical protein
MDSQNPVGLLVCDKPVEERKILAPNLRYNTVNNRMICSLNHSLSIQVGLSSRVGAEWEASNVVGLSSGLNLLLGLPNPGSFRVGVHDAGNGAVVDVPVSLADVLNRCDTLLLGLVRQHSSEGDISNYADVGNLGAVFLVNDNAASLVGFDTNVLETKAGGVGSTANSDKDNVGIEL